MTTLPPIDTPVTVTLTNYRGMAGRVKAHLADTPWPVLVEFDTRAASLRDVAAVEAFAADEIEVAA
ncbi:hypothetical protein N866_13550 [Actinotalea ferrariae CF5-4]|uniref:Uncharacterized protein n=1 Tax=Actinotalea ferrariae CF5-4 TaxID=948458 RepID=A0A021VW48_9CELL|nr:hypothetical protein [Actinotalea ferrariae]EYR64270.1 hypothetical protein N866_13550 [Actinotalea ferrariae CF5-4]